MPGRGDEQPALAGFGGNHRLAVDGVLVGVARLRLQNGPVRGDTHLGQHRRRARRLRAGLVEDAGIAAADGEFRLRELA